MRTVGVLLFEGFELLDVFGPVELFGLIPEDYTVCFHAFQPGLQRSSQGAEVLAPNSLSEPADILLVPGGMGTRRLVMDPHFLDALSQWSRSAEVVSSVCTGSAVLAAAGLLEGYRATSNKRAFHWVAEHGADVKWVAKARWVQDRDRWTSSGVAAGMDMTAAMITYFSGAEAARRAAALAELEVHTDPHCDPFAQLYGLA